MAPVDKVGDDFSFPQDFVVVRCNSDAILASLQLAAVSLDISSEHRSIASPLIMKRCEGEGLNAWLE